MRRKDTKVVSVIEKALTKALFPRIVTTSYSKESWDIVVTTFKGIDQVHVVKLQMLQIMFDSLIIKENDYA